LGDHFHDLTVVHGGGGEAGLDDVNAQLGELPRHVQLLPRGHEGGGRWRQGTREGEDKRTKRELELGLGLKRKGQRGREWERDRRSGDTVDAPVVKNDFHSSESFSATERESHGNFKKLPKW